MELNSNSKNTDPVLTDVPPVPPAHWTPTRREISAWLHEQAPPLAELYEGAVCLIFERPFDAVFNTLSFLHYSQAEQVFSEVERVLRPNGRFYLVDPTSKSQTEPEWIAVSLGGIKLYSPNRELLGSCVGLRCVGHYYLLGPVLLRISAKPKK